jgi:alginate O-acetyltransferase complex protein AlgI
MLFSSPIFLYFFLPITLLCYFLSPKKIKNYTLLLSSLIFYGWGGISFLLLLLTSVLINYVSGILVSNSKTAKGKKNVLAIGVVLNLLLLLYFKYANFFVENLNLISPVELKISKIILPIGISFFTFQAMSYLIDVYRGTANVQKNFAKLMLYVSLFPQLVAGPIVRYKDVAEQIDERRVTFDKFTSGIRRFMLGLMRKVLIANPMAVIADQAFSTNPDLLTPAMAWLGIIAYSIQIYYDFAGYSDMAIGLGRMFGFEFLENFNFPYFAKSVKDFWHRWHISLSTWFKDYVYIPLGGNRFGEGRTYLNLTIVFLVTGFWHGAAWNFVVWGMIHGLFLILERHLLKSTLKVLPTFIQRTYTLLVVMIAWVFFRANNIFDAWAYLKTMFGVNRSVFYNNRVFEFIDLQTILIFTIAVLGSTPVLQKINVLWNTYNLRSKNDFSFYSLHLYQLSMIVFLTVGLLLSTMMLISNSYNPFIYFRF